MDEERCVPNAGYAALQTNLKALIDAVRDYVHIR
jgi:hypothetical protein